MAEISKEEFFKKATETFSNVMVVNQTSYNIQDHWLKLAANYFNIDMSRLSTDLMLNQCGHRLSLLKAGLFGYVNEIASSEIKSSVYQKNLIYDEHFLNTASFPESIFNFAKLYNVEITNGTPSHMKVQLVLRKADLLNSSLLEEITDDQVIESTTLKTYQLIISKDYQFTVGKYSFLLPYDVRILIKKTNINNDYTITARYLSTDNDFEFMDINSPEIKVFQDTGSAEENIYFELDIYQLEESTTEYTIASEDISDNLFYDATYKNQLAKFDVYYEYNGIRYKLKKYFNNTYTPKDANERYCYYTYVDDDKLQISFSSIANSFRPRYNSRIIINVYTTYGSEGNFDYNDEILFNFTSKATSSYSKMLCKVYPLSSASGGKDELSIQEEKKKIIQKVLGRDNLIMDRDLETYFDLINDMDSVNNSSIKFIKKRDDVIQRLYSAFLLMRDKDQKVIPTNTAKWSMIRKGYFDDSGNHYNNELIIPEHSVFIYNKDKDRYEFYEAGLDSNIKNKLKDKNSLVYVNPYLTKITTTPTLKATYYELDINRDFNMSYNYVNNLVEQNILINKINVAKSVNYEDDLNSDTYCISFNLNSNVNINDLDKIIKVRGKLIGRNSKKDYGYFEFKRGDITSSVYDQSKYYAYISTNRKFKDDLLSIADSLYDIDGNVIENQFIEEELTIKIGVLIKDVVRGNVHPDNENVKLFSDSFPKNEAEAINIDDYTLATAVSTDDIVYLYRNLSNIMTSITTRTIDSASSWQSGENTIGVNLNNHIEHNGDTWVVFNDEIHEVDSSGNFSNKDNTRHFHVIGDAVYEWLDDPNGASGAKAPTKRLFKCITSNSVDYNHDYSKDPNNMRLRGIIAMVRDGVYVVRSDYTFTTINGDKYILYNNKTNQGLHYIDKNGGIHKVKHDGSFSSDTLVFTKVDPSTKTYVMFYDQLYNVTSDDGRFTDRRGDTYQITGSGLYKLENGKRFRVESALKVNRSRNYTDAEISNLRPKGVYVVMHDQIYKTDEYGLFIGYKKYHYRIILSGSYQGVYVITQNESIFKLDMLGNMATSKNYATDSGFPNLLNIWTGAKPADPDKPVFPFPDLSTYNNGTVDQYNAIVNAMNKTGYTYYDLIADGLFKDFIPEEDKDFKIELIPLISLNYFMYEADNIFSIIDTYIVTLEEVVKRLENNTNVDLKFYNTYGPSSYWYLSLNSDKVSNTNDNVIAPSYISRVDFLYDFKIHLFESINDDIDKNIKEFISKYVEASNSENVIPVSNLMRLLEQNFEIIRYIEFNGLAGEYNETIQNKYQVIKNRAVDFLDMSVQEIREYVPEYMNIKKSLEDSKINVTDSAGNVTTVTLAKKNYNNVINISYEL